jgi:hypothetical protein
VWLPVAPKPLGYLLLAMECCAARPLISHILLSHFVHKPETKGERGVRNGRVWFAYHSLSFMMTTTFLPVGGADDAEVEASNIEHQSQRRHHELTGVLFSRSRGCTFSSLSLAVDGGQEPVLVRLQFPKAVSPETTKELRSFCRRSYKLGDRLGIRYNYFNHKDQQHHHQDGNTSTRLERAAAGSDYTSCHEL